MALEDQLRIAALNRHRKRLFGDVSLTVYTMTPADGETEAEIFETNWMGQRVENTTTNTGTEQSEWQFQIAAADDWQSSQSFMRSITALTIGGRRWKVRKVEKPVGRSMVWKVKAYEQ